MTETGSETETRVVAACSKCGVHWYLDREPAKCTAPDHEPQLFETHVHRSTVVLPDGTSVMAVSFDRFDPYRRGVAPDFGLYLDHAWQAPWPSDRVEWPDFGVPADAGLLRTSLQSLLDRARAGERVELGCLGGHGRTGTALGCLAVLAGVPPAEAVAWVRANYCEKAVETPDQEAFVSGFTDITDPGGPS